MNPCLLYVPVPSLEVGRGIACALVESRQAACVKHHSPNLQLLSVGGGSGRGGRGGAPH